MDKDRTEGSANRVKGGILGFLGRVCGNQKMRVEGKTLQKTGKARTAVAHAKDAFQEE